MRRFGLVWLMAILPIQIGNAGEKPQRDWKTYRSEKFGYELSYPPEMAFIPYFDGSSGDLKTISTGKAVANFEVWPPDECLLQPEGMDAKEIGVKRAKDITQADGHGSSSYCGDPLTIREVSSLHGVKIFELELTCMSETYPDAGDDEMDLEEDPIDSDEAPIVTCEGKKGPAFFVDISQSWIERILMVDPVGNNPLIHKDNDRIDMSIIRTILSRLKAFPTPKPAGICIEDLQMRKPVMQGIPVQQYSR
jgi:hypothetical protein